MLITPDFGAQGPGLNPARGGDQFMTVWCFSAQSFSFSMISF